jgi:hypothetical protein
MFLTPALGEKRQRESLTAYDMLGFAGPVDARDDAHTFRARYAGFPEDGVFREGNTWNLDDSALGKNALMTRAVDYSVLASTDFYTAALLPFAYTEGLSVSWNVLTMDAPPVVSRVPHEGVSPLLTSQKMARSAQMVRRGLAVNIDEEFFSTTEGAETFALRMRGLVRSIKNTINLGAMEVLMSSRDTDAAAIHSATRGEGVAQACSEEIFNYAALQSRPHALPELVGTAAQSMRRQGVVADACVVPPGALHYLRFSRPENAPSYESDGHMQAAGPMQVAGCAVYEADYVTFDKGADNDLRCPFVRRREVGEYYVTSSGRVEMYDESHDRDIPVAGSEVLAMVEKAVIREDTDALAKWATDHWDRMCRVHPPGDPRMLISPDLLLTRYVNQEGAVEYNAVAARVEQRGDGSESDIVVGVHHGDFAKLNPLYFPMTTANEDYFDGFFEVGMKVAFCKDVRNDKTLHAELARYAADDPSASKENQLEKALSQYANRHVDDPVQVERFLIWFAPSKLNLLDRVAASFVDNGGGGATALEKACVVGLAAAGCRGKLFTDGELLHYLMMKGVKDDDEKDAHSEFYDWLITKETVGYWPLGYWEGASGDTFIDLTVAVMFARPHISHMMGSAVVMKAGAETGATLHGPENGFALARVNDKLLGNMTFYSKSYIKTPANVRVISDVYSTSYVGGNGLAALELEEATTSLPGPSGAGGRCHLRGSLTAMLVPKRWSPGRGGTRGPVDAFDITGVYTDVLAAACDGGRTGPHLPCGPRNYLRLVGWETLGPRRQYVGMRATVKLPVQFAGDRALTKEYTADLHRRWLTPDGGLYGSERNTLLYRGAATVNKNEYVPGNGHWKNCTGQGAGRVRGGYGGRFDRQRTSATSFAPFDHYYGEADVSQRVNYAEGALRPAHRAAQPE